jgi:hypothetical protein
MTTPRKVQVTERPRKNGDDSLDMDDNSPGAMKIIGYNGRAPRALLNFTKRSCPDVLFLSETHQEKWPTECLKRRLRMDFMEVIQSNG